MLAAGVFWKHAIRDPLPVALGVGANTALFGVIYTVLIQPLPFREPGKLVQIWETHPALPQLQVAVPDFQDWLNEAQSFEQVAAYTLSADRPRHHGGQQ